MRKILLAYGICPIMVLFLGLLPGWGCSAEVQLDKIELPAGFSIDIYADDLPGARSMALSPAGVLYVGTRTEGRVYAVEDRDGDHRAEKKFVLAEDLNMPNGVAFRDGALYVAEVSRILRYPEIEKNLNNPGKPEVINDQFPDDRLHGWKFIAFGPDGLLYVPVGAPCNICNPQDPYAAILRMKADGSGLEIYARGVRNTVGFDWHPVSRELWFTDNGRDMMGDDKPPDELNRVPEKGLHFGYPFWHGGDVADPEYGDKKPKDSFIQPALKMDAHVAALGMRFYTGSMFPKSYHGRIFIAQHGSWNRTIPIGYRVMAVDLDGNKVLKSEVFASGWLQGMKAWGRPVDVLVMPDGALLVSDDKVGVIYRISYVEP
ncbi:MAG: sorbosone dehydrogenase family protein [Desulfurivibrionaceae bacterium]